MTNSASTQPNILRPRYRLRLGRIVLESPGRFAFGTAGKVSEFSSLVISLLRKLPSWAIAFTLSLFLALAVIAANLIHAALSSRDIVLEGEAGTLLYVSAYSGFIDEWDLYEGQQSAKIVDEQLELRVRAPQTAAWSSARPRFRDFDLSVAISAQEGPIDNAMGVIFHAQDIEDGACDLPAVILCGIDQHIPLAGAALRQIIDMTDTESHFAFLISSDGYYSLRKSKAGKTQLLSAWIASPHIKQGLGARNTVRVVARDSRYRFFINGTQVALCLPEDASATSTFVAGDCVDGIMQELYHDESFESGKLGLIAQSTATGGGGVVIRFDNLLVFSPADPNSEDAKL